MDHGSPHCSKHHGVPPGRGGGGPVRHFDISRYAVPSALDGRVRRRLLDGCGFGAVGLTGMGLGGRLKISLVSLRKLESLNFAILLICRTVRTGVDLKRETGCLRVAWDALASLAAARRSALASR